MSSKFKPLDFEDDLPADFAALGEQLQADAQRLGSVYPACKPPLELIDALAAKPPRRWLRPQVALAAASAAALLLIGLSITLLILRSEPSEPAAYPTDPVIALPVQTDADPAELLHRSMPATSIAVASEQPPAGNSVPVSYRPAVMEFNGPELEGLLDLWQEQPQAASRIAF